jgi:S1-C subfamily serine protease
MGLGFAIPVNMVKGVVAAAKRGGASVKRPWLGASLQDVTKEIADSIGLDRPIGALAADVEEGGPAAEAGLKRGDVVTAIDGQPVDDSGGVGFRLGEQPLGGVASLSVLRGGKPIVLTLKLAAAPEIPPRDAVRIRSRSPFEGAMVMNISPALIEEMSIEGARKGVIVTDVAQGSTAAGVGLQKGDLVLSVNDEKIETTRDLEKAAASRPRYWKLAIGRGGEVIQSVFGG